MDRNVYFLNTGFPPAGHAAAGVSVSVRKQPGLYSHTSAAEPQSATSAGTTVHTHLHSRAPSTPVVPKCLQCPLLKEGGSTVTPHPSWHLLLQNCNLSKKRKGKRTHRSRGPPRRGPDPYFGNHWSTWTENFQNFCRQIIASVGHMVEEAGLMPDNQKVSGSMSSFLCVMTLKDEELVDKCICLNCLTEPFQHLCVCLF